MQRRLLPGRPEGDITCAGVRPAIRLDGYESADIGAYETELYRFLETRRPALLKMLSDQSPLDDRLAGDLDDALREFATAFHSPPQLAAA